MDRFRFARIVVTRLLAFVVIGALLFSALPTIAASSKSCRQPSGSRIGYAYRAMPLNQGAPLLLDLVAMIGPGAAAHVRGAILALDEATGAGTALGPYVPVLAATKSVIQADCADTDGDGTAGLVRFAADFRHVETGERVPVVLSTGTDVDASGIYAVGVQIGAETVTIDVEILVSQERVGKQKRR